MSLSLLHPSELDSSVNKNRKFQTGKHAKQQVAELNRRQQNLPPSVATGEADSIMAEYREKRGPSLMDAHAEKKAKGPSGKERGRKAFDRDMVNILLTYSSPYSITLL